MLDLLESPNTSLTNKEHLSTPSLTINRSPASQALSLAVISIGLLSFAAGCGDPPEQELDDNRIVLIGGRFAEVTLHTENDSLVVTLPRDLAPLFVFMHNTNLDGNTSLATSADALFQLLIDHETVPSISNGLKKLEDDPEQALTVLRNAARLLNFAENPDLAEAYNGFILELAKNVYSNSELELAKFYSDYAFSISLFHEELETLEIELLQKAADLYGKHVDREQDEYRRTLDRLAEKSLEAGEFETSLNANLRLKEEYERQGETESGEYLLKVARCGLLYLQCGNVEDAVKIFQGLRSKIETIPNYADENFVLEIAFTCLGSLELEAGNFEIGVDLIVQAAQLDSGPDSNEVVVLSEYVDDWASTFAEKGMGILATHFEAARDSLK